MYSKEQRYLRKSLKKQFLKRNSMENNSLEGE